MPRRRHVGLLLCGHWAASSEYPIVHDVDEADARMFISTKLLHGQDLGRLLKGHPKGLPVGEAADFSVEVASALAHAYGLGILHRDLKPSNLFAQDDGPLKVLYFGISRDRNATSGTTGSGQALGTPFYMAPEQLRDAEPSLSATEMRLPRGFWRRSRAISDSNVGAS
jgi:serine/threonine protein kinase